MKTILTVSEALKVTSPYWWVTTPILTKLLINRVSVWSPQTFLCPLPLFTHALFILAVRVIFIPKQPSCVL